MAHYAQLDENNVVTQVIVVHNNELVESKQTTVNEDGTVSVFIIESEQKGIDFCKSLFGVDTRWVQTSYNGSFRGKYAGIGDTYDGSNFIAPVIEQAEVVAPVIQQAEVSASLVEVTQEVISLASDTIQTLTTTDIPALTTADISSLG